MVKNLHLPQKKRPLLYRTHHSTQPVAQFLNVVPKIVQTFSKPKSFNTFHFIWIFGNFHNLVQPSFQLWFKESGKKLGNHSTNPTSFPTHPIKSPRIPGFCRNFPTQNGQPEKEKSEHRNDRLFCLEVRPCFEGLTFKNRGHWGSRYMLHILHMYIISQKCSWGVRIHKATSSVNRKNLFRIFYLFGGWFKPTQ